MKIEKLRKLCRVWQARLGLAHWQIDVYVVRGSEIEDNMAQVMYNTESEVAMIRLKDPNDCHGLVKQDMEESIVHELLHVLMDPLISGKASPGIFYEQMLDRLARVLIKLGRAQERNG